MPIVAIILGSFMRPTTDWALGKLWKYWSFNSLDL